MINQEKFNQEYARARAGAATLAGDQVETEKWSALANETSEIAQVGYEPENEIVITRAQLAALRAEVAALCEDANRLAGLIEFILAWTDRYGKIHGKFRLNRPYAESVLADHAAIRNQKSAIE